MANSDLPETFSDGQVGRLWAECMLEIVRSDPAMRHDNRWNMAMTKDQKLRIVVHFWNNQHPLVINDTPEVIRTLIDKYRASTYVRHLDCEEAEAEIVRRTLDE